MMERIVAIEERTLGPEHPLLVDSLSNLALLYEKLGREDEVEAIFSQGTGHR